MTTPEAASVGAPFIPRGRVSARRRRAGRSSRIIRAEHSFVPVVMEASVTPATQLRHTPLLLICLKGEEEHHGR